MSTQHEPTGERIVRIETKLDELPASIGLQIVEAMKPIHETLSRHERELNFWKWTQRALAVAWAAVLAYMGAKHN